MSMKTENYENMSVEELLKTRAILVKQFRRAIANNIPGSNGSMHIRKHEKEIVKIDAFLNPLGYFYGKKVN